MFYPKIHCERRRPWYTYPYDSGNTNGSLLSETLHLPNGSDFLVGCSVRSTNLSTGIAGLGRGAFSLPSQLDIKKFSYCPVSQPRFGDTNKSSSLILVAGKDFIKKTKGVSYTPFVKNPEVPGNKALKTYYYVDLRRITVGGQRVEIPGRYPGQNGSDGTIVDSGTTFTNLAPEVFDGVVGEFEKLMGHKRAEEAENRTGWWACYNVSGIETPTFSLTFHFEGGAEMAVPVENYMVLDRGEVRCLAIQSDEMSGPSIILGSFQMQNYHVEYDLKNEMFGFKQCN